MRKNLSSKTDNSERANLWNSVIKRGGGIFDESFELTPEMIEQIERASKFNISRDGIFSGYIDSLYALQKLRRLLS